MMGQGILDHLGGQESRLPLDWASQRARTGGVGTTGTTRSLRTAYWTSGQFHNRIYWPILSKHPPTSTQRKVFCTQGI